jgi:hypothetical protein
LNCQDSRLSSWWATEAKQNIRRNLFGAKRVEERSRESIIVSPFFRSIYKILKNTRFTNLQISFYDLVAMTKRIKEKRNEAVVHAYHDHANEVEKVAENSEESNAVEESFPYKLHYMLTELETDGMDDIVSWQPHGRCFLVHDQKAFVDQVLPL